MPTLYNTTLSSPACQANLAVQEARLQAAMTDLNEAQAQLDEKQRELDVVQALYDDAMSKKQVFYCDFHSC